ncbi:MAG: hypothetical protein RIS86_1594 [Planctomycetota bacterium]
MRLHTSLAAVVATLPLLPAAVLVPAAVAATPVSTPDDTERPVAMRADLAIGSVTLYRGRAAVTREGSVDLDAGLYELRVGPLPASADLESVQARIGGGAGLLDVKTETVARPAPTSDNPRVREALARVEAAEAAKSDLERRLANNAAAQKTVDSIAAKAASDASQSLGGGLDPERLRAQLAFIEDERERLTAAQAELSRGLRAAAGELDAAQRALADAGGAPPTERFALVTVAVPDAGKVPVAVTYLVRDADWTPSYTVRGDPEAGTLVLEFDAVVRQATGEDWDEVALVLSTAVPTRAANPARVEPVYLEIVEPMPDEAYGFLGGGSGGAEFGIALNRAEPMAAPGAPMMDAAPMEKSDRARRAMADASAGGTGPAAEYRIPRAFTAASDAAAEARTRVATIDAKPDFTLVAKPVVDQSVYLRADFRNESPYLLLPGQARMYLGADSIGRTTIGETPVGGEVELWFGKEPRVTVKRELVSRKSSESGVFSKSKEISREYRIELANTLARAVDVEVWDRVPVSRSADARIEIREISPALSEDAQYLKDARPQGLLKWTVALPARDAGEPKPVAISWRTRLSWPDGKLLEGDVD